MVDPSNDEPKVIGNRYALVMAVAKRARQLRDGAPRLVECKSKNPITCALQEIATGKLKIITPTEEEMEAADKLALAARRGRQGETSDILKISEPALLEIDDSDSLLDDMDLDEEESEDLAAALGDVDEEDEVDEEEAVDEAEESESDELEVETSDDSEVEAETEE